MKKIFLTTVIAAVFTANVFAADGVKKTNDDGTANVSYVVENKFKNDFLRAKNVTWTVTANVQKATFTVDDVKMTAFYNLRGEYMGVTQSVQYKALPEKAKKEISQKYEGYLANDVIKLDTGEDSFDSIVYFVDLKKDDSEVILRVTPASNIYLFKSVK